ncbi:right-handed parallel beta-helix repeat-containing protein [Cohnella sp. REN36]|uniref:right-handed parallel beta-helix repeat-containing protein n=1 Tax=Cohnella sp. REN36 TaxID=2887347 RepID=UPI001D13987B|nr:right-handed parallel beta-helix repeat-containing protein [Cohnella sp. REN36]MCC3375212.1 right-handed parallel beta-helix repeat-containing protein [Cohnella sp. REN36]
MQDNVQDRERRDVRPSETAVLRLTDFGAEPDSGRDALPAMRRAIEAASKLQGPVRVECEPGRYDFYREHASNVLYRVTNTASEEENPDPTKAVGILLQGLKEFTLDGRGALFAFHGKLTMLAIDGCDGVEIRNVKFDYEWPTVAEMTVVRVGSDYMDVRPHPSSRYEIADGKLYWIGPGWRFREGPMQAYDPETNRTWRIENAVERAEHAEEIGPSLVRLRFGFAPEPTVGLVLQARDGIRDQVGAFILQSRNVTFADVGLHFMHGLGVVGQFSENLVFDAVTIAPRPETGRTVAGFADGIHLSGCRGHVRISGCRFEGLHDDGVNVHGTYLRVMERIGPRRLRVRFMHPQTYGFDAFFPGDELEFVRSATLEACGTGTVERAERLSPREILLTLREDLPEGAGEGDAVENVTWTPAVEICGNTFARIPTRGILATTRRRTVIENNRFEGLIMSAILVSGEAASWYESGRVTELIVRGNRFADCGGAEFPPVLIAPEIEEPDEAHPVHGGIAIEDNVFELRGGPATGATSVRSLRFRNNVIRLPGSEAARIRKPEDDARLTACPDAIVDDNRYAEMEDPQTR